MFHPCWHGLPKQKAWRTARLGNSIELRLSRILGYVTVGRAEQF